MAELWSNHWFGVTPRFRNFRVKNEPKSRILNFKFRQFRIIPNQFFGHNSVFIWPNRLTVFLKDRTNHSYQKTPLFSKIGRIGTEILSKYWIGMSLKFRNSKVKIRDFGSFLTLKFRNPRVTPNQWFDHNSAIFWPILANKCSTWSPRWAESFGSTFRPSGLFFDRNFLVVRYTNNSRTPCTLRNYNEPLNVIINR